ncbi:MAG: SOS response-associated peptidase [bacterium]|nr:MAG: SOS response-associated peptidase [bacterium]
MCGRFVQNALFSVVAREFNLRSTEVDLPPRYNIAPTQEVAAVINDDGNRLVMCRWGLVPPWADDLSIGSRMINARAETLSEKRSFKEAFRKRRCLVIGTGFYEWKKAGKRKVPVFIRVKDQNTFGFAGLYSDWRSPEGVTIRTCTIITTEANDLLRPIHDRMPVILYSRARDHWLDPRVQHPQRLKPLLVPYDPDRMEAWQVSTRVNTPAHDGPELIEPVFDSN